MHSFQLETNGKLRFVFQMKYGKHLVSTSAIYQLNGYFRHFAGHLTYNSNFRGYNRLRKLKTANIYPHVFEAKTRKFGDAKIFHFTVYIILEKTLFSNEIFHLKHFLWGLLNTDKKKLPMSKVCIGPFLSVLAKFLFCTTWAKKISSLCIGQVSFLYWSCSSVLIWPSFFSVMAMFCFLH